jgi:hypothetical protein
MMNTPSMYSVDQLLKARQNGVPDYVVVPMLQKAMAQKQAMAQQQALQQGAPKPPVAQQILDAAHNDVMQEHMARQVEEAPEPRGIDSLPSGIDESDYAHGGIIAFAEGGGINDYPAFDASPYADPYSPNEVDPVALKEQYKSMVGTDPNVAKQEERIKAREEGLKSEEDSAPWMALMQAGLATMAGTSPNALSNIGAGATKGLESYGESKKNLSARADKLDDLRGKIEESQRAEALAAANYGMNSAEHRKQANVTAKLKGAEAKESHIKNAMGYGIEKEKVAVDRERNQVSAGNAAASLAETKRYHDLLSGGKGGKETLNQEINNIEDDIKYLALQDKTMQEDINKSDDEKAQHSAWVRGKQTELLNKKRQLMKLDPLGEFTYTAPPVDDRHFWEKWSDTTPQPKKTAVGNPKIDALVSKYSQ